MNHLYAILLAGGSGTRLWPLSRKALPKQFIPLMHKQSLLQQAASRLMGTFLPEQVFTVTAERFVALARQQLNALSPSLTKNLFGEPVPKSTLPAVAWMVSKIVAQDPEAVIGVFSADHYIPDVEAFAKVLEQGVACLEGDNIVLFGVEPDHPATGYGYIVAGDPFLGQSFEAFGVKTFVEKPDRERAEQLIAAGGVFWNRGTFLFSAAGFLRLLKKHQPVLYDLCEHLQRQQTPEDMAQWFDQCPELSMDRGLVEKVDHRIVVPAHFFWQDVGNWQAVYDVTEKDQAHNAALGESLFSEATGCLVSSQSATVVLHGVHDLCVVQSGDVVFVVSREKAADIKHLMEEIKNHRPNLI